MIKKKGLLLLFLVVVAFGIARHPYLRPESAQETAADFQQVPLTFQNAPDFTLPGLNGAPISLASYRGSVVLLEFWATW